MDTTLGVNAPKKPVTARVTNTTILATVKAYLPDHNLYCLKLKYHTVGASDTIYASGPVSIPGYGASSVPMYAVGEIVSVIQDLSVGDSKDYTYTIIGRASDADFPADRPVWSSIPCTKLFNPIWTGIKNLYNSMRSHVSENIATKDRQHTAPLNILPGDHFIGSVEGPSMLFGKHVLKAGLLDTCSTTWDDINNRKQDSVHEWYLDTPCTSTHIGFAGNDYMKESYKAIDMKEGSGFAGKDPELQDEYYMVPRETTLEGTFIDGLLSVLAVPSTGQNEAGFEVPSTPVYYKYVKQDGEAMAGSASGVTLQKSLLMDLPSRTGNADGFSDQTNPPETPPERQEVTERTLSTESLFFEQNAGKVYRGGVDANKDQWKVQTPEDNAVPLQAMQPSFEPTGSETYDPLPPTLELTDPKTGQTKVYFASNSFLKFQPDGSIVLADGYGSEIRMYRGNIYISPKADLICNPGRDSMVMAGRNLALKGNKHVTLNSSTSDVLIKADKHMRVLGGASGEGYLTIENRCYDPANGGIIVRGGDSLGLTAKNIYMGLSSGKDVTAGALEVDATGAMVINASKGSLNMNGATIQATGNEVTLAGHSGPAGASILSMTGGQTTVNTRNMVVSSEAGIHVGPVESAMEVQVPNADGSSTTVTGAVSGTPSTIMVDGSAAMSGSLVAQGQVVSNTGVYARQGGFVNADPTYSGMNIRDEGFTPITVETAQTNQVQNSEQVWASMASGVGQAHVLTGQRFKYPTSQELGINPATYNLPGMRWQAFMNDATVWVEKELVDPVDQSTTMVYPGKEAWTQGTITVGLTDNPDKSLNDSYVINDTKE